MTSHIRISMLITLPLIILSGCGYLRKPRIEDTYPGDMAILSKYKLPIRVVDCEGLGTAQPGGIIPVVAIDNSYPQKTFGYPRLKYLPSSFTIRWRSAPKFEDLLDADLRSTDFRQQVDFPKNLRGTKAQILFVLDENNVWSCKLMDEQDLTKPYTLEVSQ